jgi:methylmalonyl-CoA mutase cobalamin-binding subunit
MLELRNALESQSRKWLSQGLPSRERLIAAAVKLNAWKKRNGVTGIWPTAPLLLTATLDDGIGQGIEIIELFSEVAGLAVKPLGLLQPPGRIAEACLDERPDLLGMTVLQLDSEDDLAYIGRRIPRRTRIVAGGPAFKYDPEMAPRCGVHHVAANVADYIDFLLNLKISPNAGIVEQSGPNNE